MELFHLHIHVGLNWLPHFEINGWNSLDEQMKLGNITRKIRVKKKTEYLSFTDCKVCQQKGHFDIIRKQTYTAVDGRFMSGLGFNGELCVCPLALSGDIIQF